jgi:hypothetical protein
VEFERGEQAMKTSGSQPRWRTSIPARAVPAILLGLDLAIATSAAGQGAAKPAPAEAAKKKALSD